jgi:hypothetical protein
MMSAKKDELLGAEKSKKVLVVDEDGIPYGLSKAADDSLVVAMPPPPPPLPPDPYMMGRRSRGAGAIGMLLAMAMGVGAQFPLTTRLMGNPSQGVAPKKCVRCGHEHSHSNAFCSADCCRKYKAERKASRA